MLSVKWDSFLTQTELGSKEFDKSIHFFIDSFFQFVK